MSEFKYNKIPNFLKRDGEALLYSGDGELVFYIPEEYFSASANAPASINGSFVEVMGIFDYAIFDKNGKSNGLKRFNYPTMFICQPNEIEKLKNVKLIQSTDPSDYRLLKFKDGDQVVTSVKTEQYIENAERFFTLFLITGKFSPTIPYDKGHEYFPNNLGLNGGNYGINMQFFGMIFSEQCRDPKDISKPYRLTKMPDMHSYKPIGVKVNPKYSSPYIAITSENFDESVMSSVLSTTNKNSPLERVLTQ